METVEGAAGNGVLCLTFDDSRFSDWEAALPIFARHGAHATFFAYHAIDDKAVASLRRLSAAGHSIGLHGFRHQTAPETIGRLGEEGYLADEIEPQLSAARDAGLPVRSFAYPMSRHTPQSDALLLRYFDRLRGGGDFTGAFPVGEASARRYLPGLGVGPKYKRGGAEVAAMLPEVAASNAVLVLYSHGIGETAEGVSMSRGDLETILAEAERLGMAVLGFDELDGAEDFRAPPPLWPARDMAVRVRSGTAASERPDGALAVAMDESYSWPGVELRFAGGPRDLSGAGMLRVVVSNTCGKAHMVSAALRTGADQGRSPAGSVTLRPGAVREIAIPLQNIPWVLSAPLDLPGMRQKPGTAAASTYDLSACVGLDVYRVQTSRKDTVSFTLLSATLDESAVSPAVLDASTFFPFVDKFGQFKHADWPLKIHSDKELAAAAAREEAWLAEHAESPIPGADRFGGWGDGPQLAATGRFRTEKIDGTWWLVDPDGHLFFSHGIDCVYADTPTPVTGREHFFEWLPKYGEPLYCGWKANYEPHDLNIDFAQINQKRKFGQDWKPRFADLASRRLRSWGINTMGNWSTDYARAPRLVPYTVQIDSRAFPHKLPVARKAFGDKLPDAFHPDYPAYLRGKLAAVAAWVADDPMCLGVFVDNELAWDSAEDPAAYAEQYFALVEAAVRETIPGYLYLGCRFAWGGEDVWRVASRHCDVVSVNFYERSPARDLPDGAEDKPLLIGEFHFGSLDSGMFGAGLVPAWNQKERGECYRAFVRDCLDHPRFVGCHWFQYQDQALTGRPDGEDYACGFVTACDVPYPELVRAARDVAGEMYSRRAAAIADETSSSPAALRWHCGPNTRLEGNRLVVEVPADEENTCGLATAPLDLSAFDGRPVGATIVASGTGIAKPLHWYNGLKFQFEYEDADSREMHYPNTPARLGDFPEQTIHLRDFDGTRRRKARLVLGLQESSGHVEFDLSTLRIGDPAPLWPITNQNFRCAYSASRRHQPLRGVMSPHRMTEDDFDTLQSWGATLIRYQMWGYGQKKDAPADLAAYGRWLEGKLDHFDSFVLPQAVARGMKVVLDLHDAPGGRNLSNDTRMCHDRECAEFFIETWRRIAERFKGREGIYGYDLVNEPMQTSEALPGCDFWSLQRRAAEAIREIDPDTPILVECNGQDSPGGFSTFSPLDLTNVVYEVHMYVPLAYTHQGVLWKQGEPVPYPNAEKGWNAESLRGALRPVREFQLRHGARIYCGEFSAVAWAPGADRYLRDCIDLFEEYGWDWSYHAFREWKGWCVEHEGPDAQHLVPATDTPRKQALLEGLRR